MSNETLNQAEDPIVNLANTSLELKNVSAKQLVIDSTQIDAFLVRRLNDSGDLFSIDSLNNKIDAYTDLNIYGSIATTTNLIKLATSNTSSDIVDFGIYGTYNDGVQKYAGIYRDATDDAFHFVTSVPTEPTIGGAWLSNSSLYRANINCGLINSINIVDLANKIDQSVKTTDDVVFNSATVETLLIDSTASNALVIRQNNNGSNVMTVDTATSTVTVSGDLNVAGNMTITSTQSFTVSDNLIGMASGNTGGDIVDMGFYGTYNDGVDQKYTGLYRDADSGVWNLIHETKTSPATASTWLADPTGYLATLRCGSLMLDAVTITSTELAYIDGITPGTVSASKAVVADANLDITGIRNLTMTGDFIVNKNGSAAVDIAINNIYTVAKSTALKLTNNYGSNLSTTEIRYDYYGDAYTGSGFPSTHGVNYISGRSTASNHFFRKSDYTTQLSLFDNGNVAIGSGYSHANPTTYGRLELYGSNASGTIGPHLTAKTAFDAYPLMHIVNWAHDDISICFDAYYDSTWKSSDLGSNFRIFKSSDILSFQVDSGIAQGSAITWVSALQIDTSENITIPNGNLSISAGSATTSSYITANVGSTISANAYVQGGVAKIGTFYDSASPTYAGFWNAAYAANAPNNYALLQTDTGLTYLNAPTSGTINFSINNTPLMNMTATGLRIGSTGAAADLLQVANANYSIVSSLTLGPILKFGNSTSVSSFMEFGAYNSINNIDTKNRDFHLFGTTTTTGFYLDDSAQRFGILTNAPGYTLDVNGTLACNTSFTIDTTTLSTAEIAVLDSVSAGTVSASKAVVVDANKDITGFRNLTATNSLSVSAANNLYISSVSTSGNSYLNLDGAGVGIYDSAIFLNGGSGRGQGISMYTTAQIQWYAGINYGGSDQYTIRRRTGVASKLDPEIIRYDELKGETLFRIDNSGNVYLPYGNLDVTGTISCDTAIIVDGNTLTSTELGYLDGITLGTAAASKALILNASSNLTSGINNFTIDGNLIVDTNTLYVDSASNLVGIGVAPINKLDVSGGMVIGSGYAGISTAPTDGLLIKGKLGVGVNSIASSFTNSFGGSLSLSADHSYFFMQPTMTCVSNFTNMRAAYLSPIFIANVSRTVAESMGLLIYNVVSSNAGTLTNVYGLRVQSGSSGAGTITNAYGGYFENPAYGTNKIAAYAANLAVGYTGTAPPTSGAIISGNTLIGTSTDLGFKLNVNGTGNFIGTLSCDTSLTIDAVSIGATALDYCNDINQQLSTSASPHFSALTAIDCVSASTGIFKLLNGNNAAGDQWWIGFGHGTSTADSNDRARIGVEIKAGGKGRLFFTTGAPGSQTERMRIDENGDVAIGTTDPLGYKLNVNGTGRFVSDLTIGTSVLYSSGTATFSDGAYNTRLTHAGGYSYIQAGQSSGDTTAKLRLSRYFTDSNIAELSILADTTNINGNIFGSGLGLNGVTSLGSLFQISFSNAAYDYTIIVNNIQERAAIDQQGIYMIPTIKPTGASSNLSGSWLGGTFNSDNGAITNTYGMQILTSNTGANTITNSYGLYVNTPTGAVNNYCGYFVGGITASSATIQSGSYPSVSVGSSSSLLGSLEWDHVGNVLNLQTNSHSYPIKIGNNWIYCNTSGNVGIATSNPVSYGKITINGTSANVAGPHVVATVTGDTYPLFHQLNWGHDNISLNFDAYWNTNWTSSDVGSNYQIYKVSDKLQFNYSSGVAAGSTVTWQNGIVMNASGNVGIATSNPVSYGKITINGTSANVAGPHVVATVTGDTYPLFHQLNWGHDNISLNFDAYWNTNWTSSDVGSNYQIYKVSDKLQFNYSSGVAAGSTVTWQNGIVMNASGNVGFGTDNPSYNIDVVEGNGRFYANLSNTVSDIHASVSGGADVFMYADSSGNAIMGTSTNHNLNFRTNNTTYMTLNTAGSLILTNAGGQVLSLCGSGSGSHAYMAFFPDSISNPRKAYFGFPSNGSTTLSLVNEASGDNAYSAVNHNFTGNVNTTSTYQVSGTTVIDASRNITATSINFGSTSLSTYLETSITDLTWQGPFTATSANQTVYVIKTGKQVTLTIQAYSAAANSSNVITNSVAIDAAYRPNVNIYGFILVDDNTGSYTNGNYSISTTGIITIGKLDLSPFTSSTGTNGFRTLTITYQTA